MTPLPKASYRWDGSEQAHVDMQDKAQVYAFAELKTKAVEALRQLPNFEQSVTRYFEALDRNLARAMNNPPGGLRVSLPGSPEAKDDNIIANGRANFGKVVEKVLKEYGLRDNLEPIGNDRKRNRYGNDIYWEIMQGEYNRIQEKNKVPKIVPPAVGNEKSGSKQK